MSREKIYDYEYYEPTPKKGDELDYRRKKVINIFSRYKFDRILDIGCGDGNFSVLLKEACKAREVYGIEISEKGVESARNNGVKAFQLNVDDEDFPFKNDYFDAVFCGHLIEHLYDPDHLLDEVYRTLKRRGVFVITTASLSSWINRISLLFGFQPYATNCSLRYSIGHLYELPKGNKMGEADHKKVFTYRSLVELLRLHKYTILDCIGVEIDLPNMFIFPLASLIKLVDRICRFVSVSLSHEIIVVTSKE
jgi:ubiquinone/menaquinone biosynthesis C-methylase UbiE